MTTNYYELANKNEMKRIVKMMNTYFGRSATQTVTVEGNLLVWEENYEWNRRFVLWFYENKSEFNCSNLWFENQNDYSIRVYKNKLFKTNR